MNLHDNLQKFFAGFLFLTTLAMLYVFVKLLIEVATENTSQIFLGIGVIILSFICGHIIAYLINSKTKSKNIKKNKDVKRIHN